MVQPQTAQAITNLLSGMADGQTGPLPPGLRLSGRDTLKAIAAARKDNCDCRACILLRHALDDALASLFEAMADETPAPPAPAVSADARPTTQEVAHAPGDSPPA